MVYTIEHKNNFSVLLPWETRPPYCQDPHFCLTFDPLHMNNFSHHTEQLQKIKQECILLESKINKIVQAFYNWTYIE